MTAFHSLLSLFGNIYLLLALFWIGVALWKGKNWKHKTAYAALVVALFAAPIIPDIYRTLEYRSRLARAQVLFAERCKTAGEKIYKTVEGIDGFFLLKLREEVDSSSQFEMNDPYGRDLPRESYVASMLWGRQRDGTLQDRLPDRAVYKYVVYRPDTNGPLLQARLSSRIRPNGTIELDTFPAKEKPLYGVTFDDISTYEDRQFWIAGSRLRIINMETAELLAERVGWMVDWEQGNKAGERQPWSYAARNACPPFPKLNDGYPQQLGQTRNFVEKVLKP